MIQYRPAQFSDHVAIAQLHADSRKRNYRGILSDQYLDHEVDKERLNTWHKLLKQPPKNQHVTVALQNDQLVGFCCIRLDEDPVFGSLIDNLHVVTGQQKSGVGKMLISHSAQVMCREASNRKIYLWVYENNINARAMYGHLGAGNVETREKLNGDGSIARICRYTWNDASSLVII